jgi:chorismate dehydratase
LWYHFTGLPFVFALWILRREAIEKFPLEVSALAEQLQASRDYAFNHLPDMAARLSARTGFSAMRLEEYWRGMSYDLTEGHIEGLRLYFVLCHKHGLLEREPDFHFFAAR